MAKPEVVPDKIPMRARLYGRMVWCLARLVGMTLRFRYENLDRLNDTLKEGKGAIIVTWHGRSLIPANVFRNRNYWALISLSRDGEIQNVVFRSFGFQTVRGSTGRGGVRAAMQLAKKIEAGGVLAFTPDGPRGPAHKVQEGTIFLAQRSGCPVIPLGVSAKPRWFIPTWDSYMFPYPFAKAAFVVGEPITLQRDLDEDGKQAAAAVIERAINACEQRAEQLVGATPPTNA